MWASRARTARDVGQQNLTSATVEAGGRISRLRRSNARNPHFIMAGIYGDLVYHQGAGSRHASFWTRPAFEDNEAARVALRDAAFTDVGGLVEFLNGDLARGGGTRPRSRRGDCGRGREESMVHDGDDVRQSQCRRTGLQPRSQHRRPPGLTPSAIHAGRPVRSRSSTTVPTCMARANVLSGKPPLPPTFAFCTSPTPAGRGGRATSAWTPHGASTCSSSTTTMCSAMRHCSASASSATAANNSDVVV